MRLYDRLLELPGGEEDQIMLGGITKVVEQMKQAQCFQLSQDISFACSDVLKSRPSSLLSAIDMIRAPYERTWVEWSPGERYGNRDNHHLFEHEKPQPKRVGALIWADEKCARGYVILAWEHKDDSLMVCPLGLIFNWDSTDDTPVIEQYLTSMYGDNKWVKDTVARKVSWVRDSGIPDKWTRFEGDEKERAAAQELSVRGEIIPLEPFMPFLTAWELKPGVDWYESFCDDLAGELPFLEAFLLLLGTRNTIIRQEKDNFTKLNRLRVRAKKAPLKEFIVTRLRISKGMSNRGKAAGLSREEVRYHMCMGHFKIRRTGVFWWSPHPRGKKGRPVQRTGYKVTA